MAAEANLDKVKAATPELVRLWTTKTEASVMSDFVADQVTHRFLGNPNAKVTRKHNSIALFIESICVIRFKKFRKGHKCSFTPTQRAMDFFELQQGTLDEMPPVDANLVAGYTVDDFRTITSLAVTCPSRGRNVWVIEIDLQDEGGDTLEISVQPDSPVGPVVRPKIARAEEQKEERRAD
ncbi:MAG: hypothetical protein U0R49_09865 [Fimbriimonadales bacterium]